MKKLGNDAIRRKQYNAFHYVFRYADIGRMDSARIWLRRTARIWLRRTLAIYPLSDHQLYRLRMKFDDLFLTSAGVPIKERCDGEGGDLMDRLSKNLGGLN